MTRHGRVARAITLGLLVLTLAAVLLSRSAGEQGQALGYTSCTIGGPVQVVDVTHIPAEDTMPVRVHEDTHAAQCRELGWTRMRWRNLSAGGRLSLEAPGYCAGARARLRRGDSYAVTRERMFDDANAMFAGQLDSGRVNAALRAACPELTASVVQ